jgi:hypothetical protein
MNKIILPPAVSRDIKYARIRVLWNGGKDPHYSMEQICRMENCSKTTVFFAIRGRSKKRVAKK